MPISVNKYDILTPEQANPQRTNMMKNIEAMLNASSAGYNFSRTQEQMAKNPYVGEMTKADLAKKILENKWYGPNINSEINLRNDTGAHYRTEDKATNYKLEHGGYDPEIKQTIDYFRSLSKSNNTNESYNKPSSTANDRVNYELQNIANDLPPVTLPSMPNTELSNPSLQFPSLADRIYSERNMSAIPESLYAKKVPEVPEVSGYAPQQQSQPVQYIPGTTIPLNDAMESYIKHKLGMPTPSDPARQKYLDGMLELSQKREKAAAFKALPPRAREAEISVVGPMIGGYTNAARALMEGRTPEEIAASKGYDPNDRATWPTPAPPPSAPVVTQQQKANIARNAREAIQQRVTDNLGFYPEKVMGYSPQMIGDLIQGKNAKQAGKTLAAVFMNNEENALMARGMGVQAGLGMIKMMNTKSLNDLGVPSFLQSKELLDSFRDEVRLYNNIMVGNENNTLNEMYRMKNPVNVGTEEVKNTSGSSSEFAGMSDEEVRQIAEGGE